MKKRSHTGDKEDFPWWLVAAAGIGVYLAVEVWQSPLYSQIMGTLTKGIGVTVMVTLISFLLASTLGLGLALGERCRWLVVRQICRFYIEIIRGVPIIVLLLYVAFVLAPALVDFRNWVAVIFDIDPVRSRAFPLLWRAVMALMIAYSAFIAEIFRAGLDAVPEGQVEAAKALGLSGWKRFRLVVFPQAIRTILPPLGNDFVALVKDSSLVSVLGVLDVTQLGKVTAASNFRYFETYNMVALVYLTTTVTLSLLLRRFEQRLRNRYSH
ncbi:MAG: amino acid ABC transporter permease [Epibacterium sp.]|nr:amino acid ABC transporter permease [Epibacterium sp.]NQX72964.1 amino acid ABC transporter permease [Epibacterium sp.]